MTKYRIAPSEEKDRAAIQNEVEVIRLSPLDQQRFAEALLSPPIPTPAL